MTSSVHGISSNSADGGSEEHQKQSEIGVPSQSPPGTVPMGMTMLPTEYMMPHGLVNMGQTGVQTPYSYLDPYYGSIFAAYYEGQQMVHPQFAGVHPGVPLPSDSVEEPVYVNAKQYHGILRRRQSRAKAESENKLIKNRKPYLHESRHLHALKRARGCGGRFLTSKKDEGNTSQPSDKEGSEEPCDEENVSSGSQDAAHPEPAASCSNSEMNRT